MFGYKSLYVIPLHFVAQPIICGEGDCQQGNGNNGGYRRERQRYCTAGHLEAFIYLLRSRRRTFSNPFHIHWHTHLFFEHAESTKDLCHPLLLVILTHCPR
uniref:(northern house mosquito) hypothetical protein n=1 Tax=Culex pipiens TaxID=7175 RepID=A0A8D8HCA6_CULPI